MTHKPKTQTPLFESRHKGLVEAVATPETLAKIRGTPPPERARRVLTPPPTAAVHEAPDAGDVARRESQNRELLKALERGETITVSTARVLCGTWRLGDRIADIRGMLEKRPGAASIEQVGKGVNAEYRMVPITTKPSAADAITPVPS